MSRILTSTRLNDHYTAHEIESPEIASQIVPGQFIELGVAGAPAQPSGVADVDREKGTVTVVTGGAVAGETADTEAGSPAVALRGPMGRRMALEGAGKVLCVAEGFGVAELYPRLKELKAQDTYTIAIIGFRSSDHVYWADHIDSVSDEMYVVTEDGTFGVKGPIRHTVRGVCENDLDIDRVLVTGSLKLLKVCSDVTGKYGIPTIVSLNSVVAENGVAPKSDVTANESASQFDWSQVSELDGHKVNFDELTQKLGIQITR